MKSLIINVFACLTIVVSGNSIMAQTAELTIVVKDIKELKGKILVAVKDSKNPETMVYDMAPVEQKESVVFTLKDVPAGKVDISLFQDLNENFKLDMDEQNIPLEPCYNKEKFNVKENDTNKLVVRLINVKELMMQNPN